MAIFHHTKGQVSSRTLLPETALATTNADSNNQLMCAINYFIMKKGEDKVIPNILF